MPHKPTTSCGWTAKVMKRRRQKEKETENSDTKRNEIGGCYFLWAASSQMFLQFANLLSWKFVVIKLLTSVYSYTVAAHNCVLSLTLIYMTAKCCVMCLFWAPIKNNAHTLPKGALSFLLFQPLHNLKCLSFFINTLRLHFMSRPTTISILLNWNNRLSLTKEKTTHAH